jgi:hypothetical protein
MSYEDFLKTFDVLYLCHLTADCFLSEIFKSNKVCCFLINFIKRRSMIESGNQKNRLSNFIFLCFFRIPHT